MTGQALPRGHVVAIDISQSMLRSAREHLAVFGSRVNLLACDLLYLPFESAFDVVVSTASFHWVLDHDRLFAGLRRALVPGGWLEAQCGGGPNLAGLRRRVAALAAAPPFAPYFADFREPWLFQDAESAAENLRSAGFVNVETSIEPALAVLEDAEQYTEFVRNIVLRRHLGNIPTEVERAQFTDMLTKQAAHDDPPFSLDYWRLNLRARRGWRS